MEWSFVRRHKKEWGCRYVLASLIIAVSVMLTGVCVTLYPAFLQDEMCIRDRLYRADGETASETGRRCYAGWVSAG